MGGKTEQAETFQVPSNRQPVGSQSCGWANLFRIPLAGGIEGTNPWYNFSRYNRRINDLMDVVTLQCNAHQADVHFRQVIIAEDDSYHGDNDLFECFVLFVVHNTAVSSSAA